MHCKEYLWDLIQSSQSGLLTGGCAGPYLKTGGS